MVEVAGTTGGHNLNLKCGASEEVLKKYPDNYFDSIVCDPPYFIGFQGKKNYWDRPDNDLTPVWTECYRVLKEGGYLLAFSAPRTYHRLAVQIENSGFEIKDQVMWLYASGFPKQVHSLGTGWDNYTDAAIDSAKRVMLANDQEIETEWKAPNPLEDHANQLKPAHEPICVARKKPKFDGLAAHFAGGIAGMNIGEARIPYEDGEKIADGGSVGRPFKGYDPTAKTLKSPTEKKVYEKGRHPSNVIGEVEGYQKYFFCPKTSFAEKHIGYPNAKRKSIRKDGELYDSEGKGPHEEEVEDGNPHSTVKPVALMEYLIKLVTPVGGHVLDPFLGSGSTGMAALGASYGFTGIDMNEEYQVASLIRITAWLKHLKEQKVPPTKKRKSTLAAAVIGKSKSENSEDQ